MTNDWTPYLAWWPRRLIDGTRCQFSTLLMRRQEGGAWVYRLPTDTEAQEYLSTSAW